MSARKEVDDIIAQVRKAGWRVERNSSNNNHWRFYSPDGKTMLTCPSSPQGRRWAGNMKSQLRRYGVDINHRNGRKPKR